MKITIEHNGKSIGVNTTEHTPKELMHSMIDQAIEYMDEAHEHTESFKEHWLSSSGIPSGTILPDVTSSKEDDMYYNTQDGQLYRFSPLSGWVRK